MDDEEQTRLIVLQWLYHLLHYQTPYTSTTSGETKYNTVSLPLNLFGTPYLYITIEQGSLTYDENQEELFPTFSYVSDLITDVQYTTAQLEEIFSMVQIVSSVLTPDDKPI